jgi:hypothetical protein
MIVFHAKAPTSLDLFIEFCKRNNIAFILRRMCFPSHAIVRETFWHAGNTQEVFFLEMMVDSKEPKDQEEAIDKKIKAAGIRIDEGWINVFHGGIDIERSAT